MTLTVPHWGQERLRELLGSTKDVTVDTDDGPVMIGKGRGVRGAWRMMTSSSGWRRFKTEYGVLGQIRADEITHGVNGWHPHLHLLIFLEPGEDAPGTVAEEIEGQWRLIGGVEAAMVALWGHAVEAKMGGRKILAEIGVDVRLVKDDKGLGEYVSKIEFEMTRTDLMGGRQRSRTPWEIGYDGYRWGDADDARWWREHFEATKGMQVMSVSLPEREAPGSGRGGPGRGRAARGPFRGGAIGTTAPDPVPRSWVEESIRRMRREVQAERAEQLRQIVEHRGHAR